MPPKPCARPASRVLPGVFTLLTVAAFGFSACAADIPAAGDRARDLGSAEPSDLSESAQVLGPFDFATSRYDPHGPPYPIVLVHGMAGFRNIGPIEYYFGIPDALRKDGHDVWVSLADPIADSEVRGPQVLAYVQMVLAMTGKTKVNLIGHSQGGFDVRYVASQLGTAHVASVVLIASPMLGDPIADLALSGGPGAQAALNVLLDLYGVLLGFPPNAQAQLQMLTAAGAKAFFAHHPDDPRVPYFSIAGRSNLSDGGTDCATADRPDFIARWDAERDPVNLLFQLTSQILEGLKPQPVHDGLVPVASARHGVFLGCIPADHMDQVHQLFGAPPGGNNKFDAAVFYRDLANWLVARGF